MEQAEEDNEEQDDDPGQTAFTFDQLDERAKEKARDAWRELAMQDEWWDGVYEDAVAMAKLIGIEIGMRSFRSVGKKTLYEPDIYFMLDVQGSGACYSGQLAVEQLNGAAARLAAEIGAENDQTGDGNRALHALARQGETLYKLIVLRAFTLRLLGEQQDDDDYRHDEVGTQDAIAINGDDRYYRTGISADNQFPETIADAINDYVDGFGEWIHDRLDDESMYRYSEEYVDDAIRNNDCLFDEFGSII